MNTMQRHIRRRLAVLGAERQSWEGHWKQLAGHFLPRKSRFMSDSVNHGSKSGTRLYDSTGILAARSLASGMQGGLTSPAVPWFRLALQDQDVSRSDAALEWLHSTQNRMNAMFGQSNFYEQIHALYAELAVMGTGCMLVEEDPKTFVRFKTLTAGEYYVDTGSDGRVNTLYLRLSMTARQIVEKWPDTAPARIKNAAARDDGTRWNIIHAIEPAYELHRALDADRPHGSANIRSDSRKASKTSYYDAPEKGQTRSGAGYSGTGSARSGTGYSGAGGRQPGAEYSGSGSLGAGGAYSSSGESVTSARDARFVRFARFTQFADASRGYAHDADSSWTENAGAENIWSDGAKAEERPYISVFLLEDGAGEILEQSGYYEFPALCPRWDVTGGDVYGRSPAMDALADCRMLQRIRKDTLQALSREVRPPLNVTSGAASVVPDVSPDAINYIPTGGNGEAVTPLYQVRSNLHAAEATVQACRDQIRKAFFNDLFMMLAGINRQMTATEVAERNAEKMLMLGPVLDRLRSEVFQPLVERVFSIMARNACLDSAPPILAEEKLKIEFVSVLAQAQKAAGIAAVTQVVGFAAQLAGIAPQTLDKVNADEALDEVAEMLGVPPALIRGRESVALLRQQRAEMQAQAAQAQQVHQEINVASTLAKAAKDAGISAQNIGELLQGNEPVER